MFIKTIKFLLGLAVGIPLAIVVFAFMVGFLKACVDEIGNQDEQQHSMETTIMSSSMKT